MKLFELKRALAEKSESGKAIYQQAIQDGGRALTPDEQTRADGLKSECVELTRKIKLFEDAETFEAMSPEERSAPNTGGRLGPELPDLDGRVPYSLVRALNMQLAVREGKGKYNGLEYECHVELEKYSERKADGIRVPWNLATPRQAGRVPERRDLTTATASGTIANILGLQLIDVLRNKMVLRAMGANVMVGLTGGTFSLPKQTAQSTAYYVAEGTAPSNSNPTFSQVTWTPRTLGAVVNTSRKALVQTSLDIEAITRNDIMKVIAIELDRVGLNGSGNGFQPMGLLQNPNIPIIALGTNGAAPTWAMVVDLEGQVASANAEFGSLGYVCSNKGRAMLKQTPKVTSTAYPIFIWEKGANPGEGEVNSYRAMATNQIPDTNVKGSSGATLTSLLYGNFESATYGMWTGIDVLVDPYSGSSTGAVKVNAFIDFDFAERYEVSFAKCVDMTHF